VKVDEDTLRHAEVIGTFLFFVLVFGAIIAGARWCWRQPTSCFDAPSTGTLGIRASADADGFVGWV